MINKFEDVCERIERIDPPFVLRSNYYGEWINSPLLRGMRSKKNSTAAVKFSGGGLERKKSPLNKGDVTRCAEPIDELVESVEAE